MNAHLVFKHIIYTITISIWFFSKICITSRRKVSFFYFTQLLRDTILKTINLKENILSNFCNINTVPFNLKIVLNKISDKKKIK